MAVYTDERMSRRYRLGQELFKQRYKSAWERKHRIYAQTTKEELSRMEMMNNNVLLRLPRKDVDFITMSLDDDVDITISTYFNQIKWAPTYLEVMAVPKELIGGRNDNDIDMEWETEIELEVGDMVISRYLPVVRALSMADSYGPSKCFMDEDGEMYILVRYRDLILRLRDYAGSGSRLNKDLFTPSGIEEGKKYERDADFYEMFPLNGYVISVPVRNEADAAIGLVESRISAKYGLIEYVGSLIERYAFDDYASDNGELEPGQLVVMTANGTSELMRGYLNRLGKDFRRIPKRHCLCILKDEAGANLSPLNLSE